MTGRFPEHFVKTRAIRRNLRAAFPERDEAAIDGLTAKIAANFGRLVAEIAHMARFSRAKSTDTLKATGDLEYPFEKHSAVYVSAHLGNWELLPLIFKQLNLPVNIIYTELDQPLLDRMLLKLRRLTGAVYVEKERALKACISAMGRGEPIAMLVDQRVDSGLTVDFFGQPTVFTRFPARMAVRFNCPIVVADAIRVRPGQFEVFFHPPIHPNGGNTDETELRMTQAMAAHIETSIRRNPEQWFCNTKRWKRPKPDKDAGPSAAEHTPEHTAEHTAGNAAGNGAAKGAANGAVAEAASGPGAPRAPQATRSRPAGQNPGQMPGTAAPEPGTPSG